VRDGQPAGSPPDLAAALAVARRSGDPDLLADALARHANVLVKAGRLADARTELDEAAAIHRQRGRGYDEARCAHLAATLSRLSGDVAGARLRARRALQLVASDTLIAVSALTELGEDALAERKGEDAAAEYASALAAARAAGLVPAALAALHRRRAAALVAAGRFAEAVRDLRAARDLFRQAGDATSAVRVLVEQATAVQQSGDFAEAERVAAEARQAAEASVDHFALADLDLLWSARALARQDGVTALAAARSAQQQALLAVAPVLYVSATLAIAQLAEATGDRLAAYEALAMGWVTLGDLLGQDLARTTFEPKVHELRERWGVTAFDAVKAEYEARRLAARERGQSSGEGV